MAEQFFVSTGDNGDTIQIDDTVPMHHVEDDGSFENVFVVNAGPDDDVIIAAKGGMLIGSWGNDSIIGGTGRDSISGGGDDDLLRGGGGGDWVSGGMGRDSFSYNSEGRTAGVRAAADASTRSGREGVDGPGDVLQADIEDLAGTPYTDILTGNASNNVLRGNGGVDQLTGLAGDDTLIASGGPSWLDGGDGNDLLQAKNTFKDYLGCGNGADTAKVDPTELFVPFASCETLTS